MATESDLAAYVQRVRHQYIDVDGVFGAQCWDQWSHYASTFLGVPAWPTYTNAGGTYPHGGYACNVYHNARAAGLDRWFEILPKTATPRAGDVAFWEYGSAWYPWSHVATVLAVTHGGRMLRCLTQNPGAVQVSDLVTSGIIGYLRPRALTIGSVNTGRTKPKPKELKVKHYHREDKTARTKGRTLAPGAGFYLHTDADRPSSNASNVVGGRGDYSITAHVYAEGKPGDVVEFFLLWQTDPNGKPQSSPHYTERAVIDRDGLIRANREFKRYVGDPKKPVAVYLRVNAPKSNKGPVKVTCADTDAHLYIVA